MSRWLSELTVLILHEVFSLCLYKFFPVYVTGREGGRESAFGCESWTVKKAEHQRIKAIELGIGEDS